jgi:hypothetical protein
VANDFKILTFDERIFDFSLQTLRPCFALSACAIFFISSLHLVSSPSVFLILTHACFCRNLRGAVPAELEFEIPDLVLTRPPVEGDEGADVHEEHFDKLSL